MNATDALRWSITRHTTGKARLDGQPPVALSNNHPKTERYPSSDTNSPLANRPTPLESAVYTVVSNLRMLLPPLASLSCSNSQVANVSSLESSTFVSQPGVLDHNNA